MGEYQVRLRRREPVADRTMAFHFDKPAGFDFRAGQSVDLTLIEPEEMDGEGAVRTFTIASGPYEDEIVVATRMRDTAFKRVAGNWAAGAEVKLEGPMGSFNLHRNQTKPAVFLAGGIGITPFRSMVRQASRDSLAHALFLFYSNRRPEDAAFLEELKDLAGMNSQFTFVPTMTGMKDTEASWPGERGFINREMLGRRVSDLRGPIYYVAGPPGMVAAMRDMLAEAGMDEDDIRTEEFAGY